MYIYCKYIYFVCIYIYFYSPSDFQVFENPSKRLSFSSGSYDRLGNYPPHTLRRCIPLDDHDGATFDL